MHAQTRLLRALQSGVISRIGGKASIRLDVRIVAATNQNLAALIEKGGFREDLFYRLNVVPIEMPPLRDRTEDIGLLAQHFLMMAAKDGLPLRKIDDGAVGQLMAMPWRGNIRELKNLIYRLALLCREDTITESTIHQFVEPAHDADPHIQGASFEAAVAQFLRDQKQRGHLREKLYPRALAQFEIPLLQHVMKQVKGNQLKAAALLGINRNTLRKKLTDYGIGPAGGR
jgi:two-component system nitrogen regulation response regulator GlnG